jgi:hypothetical protein
LQLVPVFFLAARAFPFDLRRRQRQQQRRLRHPHHLVGDAVRLMLKRIADLANH